MYETLGEERESPGVPRRELDGGVGGVTAKNEKKEGKTEITEITEITEEKHKGHTNSERNALEMYHRLRPTKKVKWTGRWSCQGDRGRLYCLDEQRER